jgi:malonate decarboxylase gamma subunit
MSEHLSSRGRAWFTGLTGVATAMPGDPDSVLAADAKLGDERARFLCVVPNPNARFPCARQGEVGLEEAYTLAARVREVMAADEDGGKRPIVAIVAVKSQAYGRREETAAIFLAAAAAANAYADARMAGHPVISLVVGHALSGGFLTHGYQANRILALDDEGVVIHAMHKEAAARITRRSVDQLQELAHSVVPMSYDVHDFAKLGLLHALLHADNPEQPTPRDIEKVSQELAAAARDAREKPRDLSIRWSSAEAQETRKATRLVRERIRQAWGEA